MAVSYLQMAIHMHVRRAAWPAMWSSLSLSLTRSLSTFLHLSLSLSCSLLADSAMCVLCNKSVCREAAVGSESLHPAFSIASRHSL